MTEGATVTCPTGGSITASPMTTVTTYYDGGGGIELATTLTPQQQQQQQGRTVQPQCMDLTMGSSPCCTGGTDSVYAAMGGCCQGKPQLVAANYTTDRMMQSGPGGNITVDPSAYSATTSVGLSPLPGAVRYFMPPTPSLGIPGGNMCLPTGMVLPVSMMGQNNPLMQPSTTNGPAGIINCSSGCLTPSPSTSSSPSPSSGTSPGMHGTNNTSTVNNLTAIPSNASTTGNIPQSQLAQYQIQLAASNTSHPPASSAPAPRRGRRPRASNGTGASQTKKKDNKTKLQQHPAAPGPTTRTKRGRKAKAPPQAITTINSTQITHPDPMAVPLDFSGNSTSTISGTQQLPYSILHSSGNIIQSLLGNNCGTLCNTNGDNESPKSNGLPINSLSSAPLPPPLPLPLPLLPTHLPIQRVPPNVTPTPAPNSVPLSPISTANASVSTPLGTPSLSYDPSSENRIPCMVPNETNEDESDEISEDPQSKRARHQLPQYGVLMCKIGGRWHLLSCGTGATMNFSSTNVPYFNNPSMPSSMDNEKSTMQGLSPFVSSVTFGVNGYSLPSPHNTPGTCGQFECEGATMGGVCRISGIPSIPHYSEIVDSLRQYLLQNSNSAVSQTQQKYMKNAVTYHGIMIPQLKQLFSTFYTEKIEQFPPHVQIFIAYKLFQNDFREEKENLSGSHLPDLALLLDKYVNDWSTCDSLASKILSALIKEEEALQKPVAEWADSPSMWRQRACCVAFVKIGRFRDNSIELVLGICCSCLRNNERFVQLGVGWLLRELSVSHKETVINFIRENCTSMSAESVRYAVEKLEQPLRKEVIGYVKAGKLTSPTVSTTNMNSNPPESSQIPYETQKPSLNTNPQSQPLSQNEDTLLSSSMTTSQAQNALQVFTNSNDGSDLVRNLDSIINRLSSPPGLDFLDPSLPQNPPSGTQSDFASDNFQVPAVIAEGEQKGGASEKPSLSNQQKKNKPVVPHPTPVMQSNHMNTQIPPTQLQTLVQPSIPTVTQIQPHQFQTQQAVHQFPVQLAQSNQIHSIAELPHTLFPGLYTQSSPMQILTMPQYYMMQQQLIQPQTAPILPSQQIQSPPVGTQSQLQQETTLHQYASTPQLQLQLQAHQQLLQAQQAQVHLSLPLATTLLHPGTSPSNLLHTQIHQGELAQTHGVPSQLITLPMQKSPMVAGRGPRGPTQLIKTPQTSHFLHPQHPPVNFPKTGQPAVQHHPLSSIHINPPQEINRTNLQPPTPQLHPQLPTQVQAQSQATQPPELTAQPQSQPQLLTQPQLHQQQTGNNLQPQTHPQTLLSIPTQHLSSPQTPSQQIQLPTQLKPPEPAPTTEATTETGGASSVVLSGTIGNQGVEPTILLCSMDGRMQALGAVSGTPKWGLDIPGEEKSSSDFSGEATPHFIPSADGSGSLYAFSKHAGGSSQLVRLPVTMSDIVSNSPFMSPDGVLYVGSRTSSVFFVDIERGTLSQLNSPTESVPEHIDPLDLESSGAHIGRIDYTVTAVDSITNRELWNATSSQFAVSVGVTGEVRCVDTLVGTLLWTFKLKTPAIAAYLVSTAVEVPNLLQTVKLPLYYYATDSSVGGLHNGIFVGESGGKSFALPTIQTALPSNMVASGPTFTLLQPNVPKYWDAQRDDYPLALLPDYSTVFTLLEGPTCAEDEEPEDTIHFVTVVDNSIANVPTDPKPTEYRFFILVPFSILTGTLGALLTIRAIYKVRQSRAQQRPKQKQVPKEHGKCTLKQENAGEPQTTPNQEIPVIQSSAQTTAATPSQPITQTVTKVETLPTPSAAAIVTHTSAATTETTVPAPTVPQITPKVPTQTEPAALKQKSDVSQEATQNVPQKLPNEQTTKEAVPVRPIEPSPSEMKPRQKSGKSKPSKSPQKPNAKTTSKQSSASAEPPEQLSTNATSSATASSLKPTSSLPVSSLNQATTTASSSTVPTTIASSRITTTSDPNSPAIQWKTHLHVGKVVVDLTRVLGYGSCGTIVYEGCLEDGRRVAVKRMLKQFYVVAQREVTLLLESDEHPNVVRYYVREEDENFIYLALTYCEKTLTKYVEDNKDVGSLLTEELKQIMVDVVSGISHIHSLNICHRDLKPDNILIDTKGHARISDMGLAKKMKDSQFSCSGSNTGSIGWQAPELIDPRIGKTGAAVDSFALGCILFYIVTNRHPFGDRHKREQNILAGNCDLSPIAHSVELLDLVSRLLLQNPADRLPVSQTLYHPFFWTPQRTLNFLVVASDKLENEKASSSIVQAFERIEPSWAAGADLCIRYWVNRLDPMLVADLSHHRWYSYDSCRDLLRVFRNKVSHYYELDEQLKIRLGRLPDGFLRYFTQRFPTLVMRTYNIIALHCPNDPAFTDYLYTHKM
ncbi:serine/threonine-protein kinase/endoribonuclease IRE1a [Pelomyxa schiedti]|nr:serine/threonine-protein kinase/endoribonuclease IRE1a [Pelomyxa schiedti]